MEIKLLRSFVLVAETKSFSIAASRCYVTQSAISQHIKLLEEELKSQLLIRSSHHISLTESGEALLPRAKEIVRMADDCEEHINAVNNVIKGELRIGVGSFIAPYIRHAATTFMERYPNVRINAEFSKACRLNYLLRNHHIDLAFTMNAAFKEEGIESQDAIPFSVCAIMGDTHPLAALKKVSYEDLMKHNIIMPDMGERVFNTFQQYIKRDLSKLHVKGIVNNPNEALAIIEDTRAITFMPKLYLKNYPNLVARTIVGLEQSLMSRAHYMRDVPLKRSAQLFLEILKDESVPYFTATEHSL